VCEKPDFVEEAANMFGSQAIVVSIDVCQEDDGSYAVYSHSGTRRTHYNLFDYVKLIEASGAGEILINSIDRDGTKKGYDIELIKQVSNSVKLPVIALGGASGIKNFEEVLHYTSASAVAAGALFVFHGSLDAVLIRYPNSNELKCFSNNF
jgi:cyclase